MDERSATLLLGERYAALGLSRAARSVLERAAEMAPDDAAPVRRLIELGLGSGRAREAREYGVELLRRDPSATSRLLVGAAQLASGELDGARFSFAAVVDAGRATALERARAMVGRARVADAEGDRAGAAANIMGAADALAAWMTADDTGPDELDREQGFIDEVVRLAVDWDRSDDVGELVAQMQASLEARADSGPRVSPAALVRALWLAARQSHGDEDVSDRDIDAALAAELAERPGSPAVRLKRCERLLRRRFRDRESREQAIAELSELASAGGGPGGFAARVHILLASAYEDDPTTIEEAARAYATALSLRPNFAAAATRLAEIRVAQGRAAEALEAVEHALRVDPEHTGAWLAAVRIASDAGAGDVASAARVLAAASPGAGVAAAPAVRLMTASSAVTRDEVLAGMHARGHRLKNLLGIIGVRARSARKLATGDLGARLGDVETALSALYDEWSQYLRSMQTDAVIETVAVAPLVREVVQSAAQLPDAGEVCVEVEVGAATPDLTGDRVLLREALTNIVHNAVQACDGRGSVKVAAHPRPGAAAAVEIRVIDTGAGIPAAELGRVFSPGYTTKKLGSGIGLAVTERIVAAHRGRIHIDSDEGQGTTVTVILPCDLAALSSFSLG